MDSGLAALIGAGGGLVGAVLTWLVGQQRILAENVTAERAKWREKIRQKAVTVHHALMYGGVSERALPRLRLEFSLLLNPHDVFDREILSCIDVVQRGHCRKYRAADFESRVSLLLKHDWDRAKLESGFPPRAWLFRVKSLSDQYASVLSSSVVPPAPCKGEPPRSELTTSTAGPAGSEGQGSVQPDPCTGPTSPAVCLLPSSRFSGTSDGRKRCRDKYEVRWSNVLLLLLVLIVLLCVTFWNPLEWCFAFSVAAVGAMVEQCANWRELASLLYP